MEGLALGFGGVVTSAGNLAGLMWIQARMVFYIAAAHGYDPAHPMRPAELLALWEVYETPAAARASLDGMGPTMAATLIESKLAGRDQSALRERLVRYVGRRMVRRFAGRLIPLVGAPDQRRPERRPPPRSWASGRSPTTAATARASRGRKSGAVRSDFPSATLPTFMSPVDQPSLIGPTKHFVRELADGQVVDCAFEVRQVTRREKRNGEAFLKISLGDVTGCVEAVAWDSVEEIAAAAQPGSVVWVTGRYAADARYGPSITVRGCRAAAPEEYDAAELLESPPVALNEMLAALDELIGTVRRPHLRELLERLLAAGSDTGERWRAAPAAKVYHQAYRHGLLEHSLSVASGVSAMASTFPGHRPRRGRGRRAAPRHRQDRGLRADGRGDRPV